MSRISLEGTNYYAVIYCCSCRKQKDSIAGHRSTWWKMMEERSWIYVTLAQGTNKLGIIVEPNAASQTHQVLMKSKW